MGLSRLCSCLIFGAALLLARAATAEDAPQSEQTTPGNEVDPEVKSAVDSLLFDVRKIVEVQVSTGWKIDRYEYEKLMPDTLLSLCRTTDEVRSFALAEAGREVNRLGGPLEKALENNGNNIKELKDLLYATRVEHALAEAIRRAPSECPIWVAPKKTFRSLQIGADRFILSGEGGGQGLIQYSGDPSREFGGFTLGGGGGGRLLLGRGFGHTWSVRVGPELSVTALVKRDEGTTTLPLQFQGAIPFVIRYTDVSWHYNVELAPLAMFTEQDPVLRYGVRFGGLIGICALQVRGFIPWGGVGGWAELFPEAGGRALLLNLKGGLRAGFDWDF